MPTFSRMPAISQKLFQINRTLKGWRGLRNVTQKCHLKIPYSHSFVLPTHLTLGPILGTFLWTQRDTKTSTRSAGCQLSVKSGFKSIGPHMAEKASEMLFRFWTSLRAVSLWQKRWGIWGRHGWKALKELYYICQHSFSQWNLQTLTIVSNFILFHCFKRF